VKFEKRLKPRFFSLALGEHSLPNVNVAHISASVQRPTLFAIRMYGLSKHPMGMRHL
jgi:hypothetical protein